MRIGLFALLLIGCSGTEAAPEPAPAEVAAPAPAPAPEPPAPAPAPAPAKPPPNKAEVPTITALPRPADVPFHPTGLQNGDFVAELALQDLVTDKAYKLSEHTGPQATSPAKAVLISFSASWCGPCKASLPQFKELEDQFGDELEIVVVTIDKNDAGRRREVQDVQRVGLKNVPVLMPTEAEVRAYLGNKRRIPHMYIVNRAGEVLVQDRGYGDKVKKMLPRQVSFAMKNPDYIPR